MPSFQDVCHHVLHAAILTMYVLNMCAIYSLGQNFRTLILWIFYDPSEGGAQTFKMVAELHYKLSTTSKVYPSPPWRLQNNSDLNVRNF